LEVVIQVSDTKLYVPSWEKDSIISTFHGNGFAKLFGQDRMINEKYYRITEGVAVSTSRTVQLARDGMA